MLSIELYLVRQNNIKINYREVQLEFFQVIYLQQIFMKFFRNGKIVP